MHTVSTKAELIKRAEGVRTRRTAHADVTAGGWTGLAGCMAPGPPGKFLQVTEPAKVLKVLPGVPGMPSLRDGDRVPYPDSTIDFVKIARAAGLTPVFADAAADRSYAGHKAADHWLPILEVARDLLTGVSGGLFTWLVLDYLGADTEGKEVLHVDFRVKEADGSEKRFRADGPANDVLEALREFEDGDG